MSTNRFTPHSARRKPLALGVAAVLALSASAVAHGATTWFVNDCTDGTNAGQFRWATNGAVSGDTIDLVTQLAPTYLNCAAGSNGFAHVLSVNSAVTVAGGVTIQGPGMNNLALSGTGVNRILVANGNIAVNDLGFKYGINTAVTTGGCIWANNNIALTNVRMYKCKGNSSTAAPAKGGSLYSNFGSVTLAGSTIDRGYATATANGNALGGSIYAFTTV
ncbi:MAG: hypothetical protein JSS28_09505, partial [Proteobacteria bacterium]|nr:hypothetical protein [Pseudomonadota bacterium]